MAVAINELLQPPTSTVVSVDTLSKIYGSVTALDGISFHINPGEIFGLIGPDGAGKTSTFHILGGIMNASAGSVSILGEPPRNVRLDIGYLTQLFSLYPDLSIDENIDYAARIRNVPEKEHRERKQYYLKLMDLDRFSSRLASQLSGGMKQKLALCCALIARPKLLLLDEPTTGVDPVSRRDFWDVLATITAEGVTVAVATPYLDEAERCSRIALLHKGRIYGTGTPKELREQLGLHRLEIRGDGLEGLRRILISPNAAITEGAIKDVQEFGDRLDVLVENEELVRTEISKLGVGSKFQISNQEPTLENVFVLSLRDQVSESMPDYPFEQKAEPGVGTAISASLLSKRFGSFNAVKDVTLDLRYGEIYGLLGANGAGKTTTIKMLCGLLQSTSGTISIAGQTKDLRNVKLRRQIGYMSQKFVLYDDLTVMENLNFYCGVYGVSPKNRRERLAWAIETFDLHGQENKLTSALPGGWKQKLSFAASVLHQPSILFLDEPTSGVDPLGRRQLWHYIRQFADQGTAILVTTHFLEEAEHCQYLGFMVAGELVAQGKPSKIKAEQPGALLEVTVAQTQAAYELLKSHLESWRVSMFGNKLHVVLENPDSDLPAVLATLSNNNLHVESHRFLPFSLEDAFIGIVQRARGNE